MFNNTFKFKIQVKITLKYASEKIIKNKYINKIEYILNFSFRNKKK